jgi:hypothetical protein
MALILDSLYDALKAAGAPEEQARAATRDVAGYDNRLNRIERDMALLKWMVGFVIALMLGLFWMQWQTLDQLAALQARVLNLETGLARVEDRLGNMETLLTGVEDRLTAIEGSFGTPRSEP